jgi:carbon storage regulator
MLVLTRKLGEEIVIGDGIRVSVVAIRGSRVRLGITAAHDVPILRHELCSPADGLGPAPGHPATPQPQP